MSSESSPTPKASYGNADPRRGVGAPQSISTKYDDLCAVWVVDGGIESTPRNVQRSEIRQLVAQRSRDQVNAQVGVIRARAALEEANRAAEAERRAAWEVVRKIEEACRKGGERKSKFEVEWIGFDEKEQWRLKQEEVSAAVARVTKRAAERKKAKAEEEKREQKNIQEEQEDNDKATEDKARNEEEERKVARVSTAAEAEEAIAAARGSAEARGAAETEEATATEEKAKLVASQSAAAELEWDGPPDDAGIELTLSNFEKDSDAAGDETAQVELGAALSSSTPGAKEQLREAEDEIPEESMEGDGTEVTGETTHLLPPEAQAHVSAATGVTGAPGTQVDGTAGIDIVAEDGDSNDQSTCPSAAITVEAILADARIKTLNIPPPGSGAVFPNGARLAATPSASASTVVEEIMDEARARAFALTSQKEDLLATKRRYVVSPSASIAFAGILAIARAKAAADLAPQEAAILVKNNKATEKGKSSGDNNKADSLLTLLTRILAKAKAEAEEDARDEVEEWTIEKRDAAVRAKNLQQEVLHEEDKAPSIFGDTNAARSVGEMEALFDDKDGSVIECIDNILTIVRSDSYDRDNTDKPINPWKIKRKEHLHKFDKTSKILEKRREAKRSMPEDSISNENASNSGVVNCHDTDSTDKPPEKLEITKKDPKRALLEDGISGETENQPPERWEMASMQSEKFPLDHYRNQDIASNLEDSHLTLGQYLPWESYSSSDSAEYMSLNPILSPSVAAVPSDTDAAWRKRAKTLAEEFEENSTGGNRPDSDGDLTFENWDPWDTAATNSSHRLTALSEALWFSSTIDW